jgi:ABC-type nitrate/sulfonate/bicarbonate transport system ATPase subunit
MLGVAMLEVQIRAKDFRSSRGVTRQVLRDVAFGAVPGEVLALLGPSGIGKSTILRIMLGLEREFEGSVRLPPGRLGVMFQEPRLLPWLSVEDNLRLVQPNDIPAPDIAALLGDVLLPPVQKLLPSALSLGMARRVALARALAVDPAILVLDEPFASLDQNLAAALGARIVDRVQRHRTLVLLSTHDVDQTLAMATRILVLANEPATLVADILVPAHDNDTAIGRLRQDLLTRFTFLGRSGGDANERSE